MYPRVKGEIIQLYLIKMGSKGDVHYAEPSRGSIEVCVSNMHGNKSCSKVSVWSTVLLCKM